MNKNLNIALKNRSSEQGFAIPIAVGLGLIMILLGVTMVVRSQGDQVTASAQKATAQSLGTAETGITRVQFLLNKYLVLANITLTNLATTPPSSSWKQTYNASPICGAGVGGSTEVNGYRLDEWTSLGSSNQFRVTKYIYRPTRFGPAQIPSGVTTIPAPASSSVVVGISPATYLVDGTSVNGQIQDIKGTLSRSGATYTFTRLLLGTATLITDNFIADPGAQITSGVTIPASGSVAVVISPATYLADSTSIDGQIEGIQGTLSRSGATYTFERLFSGTATATTGKFFPTTTPGVGTLEAEGQIGTNIKAISSVQVDIPVPSGDISTVPVPGAFIGTGGTGNNTIQGNVLLRDCGVSVGDVKVTGTDPDTGLLYKATHTNLVLPKLPFRPTFITTPTNHILGAITSVESVPGAVNTGGSHYSLTLPRAGDTATNGVYEYSLTSMNLSNGSSLVITPGKKVKLYLEGNIEKGGDITHNCSTFISEDLNSNGLLDPGEDSNGSGVLETTCKPTDFQIFGYGASGSKICMNGNGYIEAFILAPNYTAGAAGTGGTGGIKGSVWINSWSDTAGCGSNTSNIVITQTASWTDIGLTPRNLTPKTAPISSWKRQEAL